MSAKLTLKPGEKVSELGVLTNDSALAMARANLLGTPGASFASPFRSWQPQEIGRF